MKNIFKFFSKSSGFTLVELLVVIGILAILATALLAAINPVEQIAKGRDQGMKELISQVQTGLTAYQADYPGDNSGATGTQWQQYCGSIGTTAVKGNAGAATNCLSVAVTAKELKQSFRNDPRLAQLYFTNDAAYPNANSINVCFKPQSYQVKSDLTNTKYNTDGTACVPGAAATNPCYWCAK